MIYFSQAFSTEKMRTRTLITIGLCCFTLAGFSQNRIVLNIGAKHQPLKWTSDAGTRAEEFRPIIKADFGIQHSIAESYGLWEALLSYRHSRQISDFKIRDHNNQIIDEFYAEDIFNQVGLKAGIGFSPERSGAGNGFMMSFGGQCHFPILSVSKSNDRPDVKLYRGDRLENGIHYGVYLRPGYQVDFQSSPFSCSIFAELDMLFRHGSDENPIFTGGGGIGLNYKL